MKTLRSIFTLVAAILIGSFTTVSSQTTAKVQIIHNSADIISQNVDVYVNGALFIDDFKFRTATRFIEVPGNTPLDIEIVPQSENQENIEISWNQSFTLKSGETYILVANGLLSEDRYSTFQPFDLYPFAGARESAISSPAQASTDVLVFHGSTDAPIVDVWESNIVGGEVIDNLTYGDFAGYLSLPTNDYTLQVRDESGTQVVETYAAPLKLLGLEGAAISVIASGFLSPLDGDPGFGLYVALPTGGNLVPLRVVNETTSSASSSARVQVIHNSADAAAAVVDIWLDNTLLLDNFAFRTASPFVDAPAGTEFTIAIQGPDSQSPENPIWSMNYTLADGETYILVADGIVSVSGYEPNQPFDIAVYPMGREMANMMDNTDVLVHHGSTDAPTVDVYEVGFGAGEIVNDLMYMDFAGYLELGTMDYILEVRDETGESAVASYTAPLATLGLDGAAISVVASGFLNPANNSNGPAFGLYVALADGGELVPLPEYDPMARVQVIHNSADAAAAVVDVWLDNTLLLDNFAFRTASPFVDAPAGTEFTIAIQGPDSQSPENPIWSQNYTLADGETYILVADGIVSASGYEPNQPFDISVYPMGREMANMMDKTDVLVHHGSTDAPTVDVYETGVGAGEIVNDLMYMDFAGYLELGTMDYILEVRDETGESAVASYTAPLATLGLDGAAISVVASGFLNPANNSNGPAFGLYVALADGGELVPLPEYDPMARVQVIHNSADAAAAVVDVWLDNTLLLDNFAFRTASPFVDAPAGTEFTIAIQGPDSQSPENPIWSMNYTLADGETYILVADGIVSASGYEPNQPFDIAVYPMGREMATMTENTDVLVHHGSTDAPTVDVYEVGVGAGEIVNDLMYMDFAGYLELGTMDYILEVRDETGESAVASYTAPLATLGLDGAAISVVASGFLNPANNSNGPAFGLYVALADGGELVPLPEYDPMARVQVIHNSADAAAAVVDVWLDNTLLLDNFAFRTASPFVDAPAGTEFTIAIQGPDSQSPENPIWSMNYTLADGETYILVADGIVSASGYEPNKPFDIAVYPMGREMANMMDKTDVLVHHGSTDAPTVDVYETGVGAGEIVNDLMYMDFAGYLELGTMDYILEVRDETGMNTVAAYQAPLATLGLDGAAISVVASGFLNPANNSDGPAFGLYVALAGGGDLVALPMYEPMARVQVIHNSADAAAAVVDVWLDNTLLLDNFAFRTASPFVDAPAGTEFTIAIQGPDSQSPENPIWSQNYTLADGETYILVPDGIVSASGYEPNKPFDIAVYPMGREMATMTGNTDVLVHHGSTDAPTVDIYEVGIGTGEIVNNLMYMDFAGYLELPTDNYTLQLRDETGENAVATFVAPLDDLMLDGEAITVVASGFLNPDNNSNGEAFGLYVALASGGELVPLTSTTGVDKIIDVSSLSIYPNPVISEVNLAFSVKQDDDVRVDIMNILGSTMISKEIVNLQKNTTHRESFNVNDLPEGIYIMSINASESVVTRKIQVIK